MEDFFANYNRVHAIRGAIAKFANDLAGLMKDAEEENDRTSLYIGSSLLEMISIMLFSMHEPETFGILHETIQKFEKLSGIGERNAAMIEKSIENPEVMNKLSDLMGRSNIKIDPEALKKMMKEFADYKKNK